MYVGILLWLLYDTNRCFVQMVLDVPLRFWINYPPARASLIGTVDLAGPCERVHFINEGPLISSCPKDYTAVPGEQKLLKAA